MGLVANTPRDCGSRGYGWAIFLSGAWGNVLGGELS